MAWRKSKATKTRHNRHRSSSWDTPTQRKIVERADELLKGENGSITVVVKPFKMDVKAFSGRVENVEVSKFHIIRYDNSFVIQHRDGPSWGWSIELDPINTNAENFYKKFLRNAIVSSECESCGGTGGHDDPEFRGSYSPGPAVRCRECEGKGTAMF